MLNCFSRVWLFAILQPCQVPLSMGFSREEHWSGLPCPPPGDLPNPGIKPVSLMTPALVSGFFTTSATWETYGSYIYIYIYMSIPCYKPCLYLLVHIYIYIIIIIFPLAPIRLSCLAQWRGPVRSGRPSRPSCPTRKRS